jgi:predicted dehydrogenase
MPVEIGIVGAGKRGLSHASEYEAIDEADVVAVADIDEASANSLAEEFEVPAVYRDYREMLTDADIDAVSVCVHNNLHRPVAVDAFETGADVFSEKPLAGTYADAKAMAKAAESAGCHLGVQNGTLFSPETRAAKRFIEDGNLGKPYYGRAIFSRRRGRPYVDGYGTPAFVSKDSAGGGPIIDIGTYVIGRMLHLLDNPDVDRVNGATFEHTDDAYAEELVGDNRTVYETRLEESGYDVEDVGVGFIQLDGGRVLSVRAAWHMFHPEESDVVVGSQGGLQMDPLEYHTTTSDYETTTSIDVDEYERRQGLIESEGGYESERDVGQFRHWIDTLTGKADDPIPSGELALESMLIMEGIYLAQQAGRELSTEEIANRSESTAIEP